MFAANRTLLDNPDMADTLMGKAAAKLKHVLDTGGGLLVLTGAGMSVSSGVPVFRNSGMDTAVACLLLTGAGIRWIDVIRLPWFSRQLQRGAGASRNAARR